MAIGGAVPYLSPLLINITIASETAKMKILDDVGTNVIVTGAIACALITIAFVLSFLYAFAGPRPGTYCMPSSVIFID